MKDQDKKKEQLLHKLEGSETEHKGTRETGAKLLQSEEILRMLIDGAKDYGIITLDPDGRVLTWNPGAERIKGYRAEEIIGQHFSRFYPREDIEQGKPERELKTAAAEGRFEDEGWRVRKDGSKFWANVIFSPLRDAQARLVGFSKITRDLTERYQAEEELKKHRDHLEELVKERTAELRAASLYSRSLIEASLDPLVTIGRDGKITDANAATGKATGIPRERLIGDDFANYFTEPEKAREGYNRAFTEGSVRDYPLTLKHVSGSTTHVLCNTSVYEDEAGEVKGVFAAARDVTEQKRTTEVIQRQAQEILEISTPVLQVWEGVLVAPLIGTLDSQRTQRFMERLLERIVETNSAVALVDITGVPTIDTQTAQHLIDTISAVRLLGAQVILTGVRPAIAQSLVHLGIDLSGITTRPSLAAGLQVAIDALGLQLIAGKKSSGREA